MRSACICMNLNYMSLLKMHLFVDAFFEMVRYISVINTYYYVKKNYLKY